MRASVAGYYSIEFRPWLPSHRIHLTIIIIQPHPTIHQISTMPAKQSKATTTTNKTAAEVIKAVDLAPQAFGGAGSGKKDALEGKPDDLQYDLHHLAALDSHPVRA